jgi:hypothetical protein
VLVEDGPHIDRVGERFGLTLTCSVIRDRAA